MINNTCEAEVLVNGKPLKEYANDGRLYVEGKKGSTFSIRLRNNSGKRKLFVPSVDGLSVMNGEEASFDSSGYIVRPYSSLTIDGWRISDEEVAQFYFSAPNDSYRKRMERGNNLGVIGVVVFDEKERPKPIVINHFPHIQCRCIGGCYHSGGGGGSFYTTSGATGVTALCATNTSSGMNSSVNMAQASFKSQDLGTGWGESKRSEVVSVEFERESSPYATFEIYYNTREQLNRMGIDFRKEPVYVAPQAFPGQYCRPPKQ
jgi:hypothetical protein